MKGLISGSLSALILTTTSTAIAAPVNYEQINSQPSSQVALKINVPHITNSGIRNNNHFIRVAVVGMSLQDLMISVPSQMERFNGVRVRDKSGMDIAAKIEISQGNVSIIFEQPVAPGNSVEVQFTGVKMAVSTDKILLYGVTAKRVGLEGEIPIGTARIDIPN
ncbi:Protein of unknown function (DUF2808) [Nostoc sp. PCC 7524]|uniref:DUF2808 domain-containing protein n=1 Tax=Nostoc sp. (strain ATCC 29411 / PCC 7524) TaxID=28072 RepID=UPI00029F0965|nr:DUF2808 domain-containing protein [Nostoc sp. PCC 7524]AFY47816.1 Protein of unknown function (DUF2808) [Nostoc sp. PCC 7524]